MSVLIIGAGLGGLCLAQALKKHHIPFKLFEKDGQRDFRAQGYRVRISGEGVLALQYALTPDLWALFEKSSAEFDPMGVRLDAITGNQLDPATTAALGAGPRPAVDGRPQPFSVDRKTFRAVLLTGLEEGKEVFFGKQLTHYEVHDGRVRAHFSDGTVEEGALLVGADGLRSQVRRQLLPQCPLIDTQMRIVYGKTPLTAEFERRFVPVALRGMAIALDRADEAAPKTLLFEPMRFRRDDAEDLQVKLPDDYVYWVFAAHRDLVPLPDEQTLRLDHEQSAQLPLTMTQKWHPSIRALFEAQDVSQTSTLRISSVQPDLPPWEPSRRVTLLGDAIHVMPPTGGVGANTALRDAADLARRIVEIGGVDKVDAKLIGEYEDTLRSFARTAVAWSWQGGRRAFGLKPVEDCAALEL
ncbi:hypothetical protein VTN96DRAFT_2525 [Rasamsonia emersonii]